MRNTTLGLYKNTPCFKTTHSAYITHLLYCTLVLITNNTPLCKMVNFSRSVLKILHRAEKIYTGGARGARDKYEVCLLGLHSLNLEYLDTRKLNQKASKSNSS